jgi:hypothetical protein
VTYKLFPLRLIYSSINSQLHGYFAVIDRVKDGKLTSEDFHHAPVTNSINDFIKQHEQDHPKQ